MSRRTTGIVLTTLVMIGGCSSDTQPEVEPPMTFSPTTLVPPAPTRAATTAPETTTTISTTTSTTTTTTTVALPPPTEVTVPEGDLTAGEKWRAEFRAAVENDWRYGLWLYDIATVNPADQDAVDAALAYTTDAVYDGYSTYLSGLAANNQYAIPNKVIPHHLVIIDGPHEVDGYPDTVTMTYCEVDAFTVVEEKPDGATAIIDDNIYNRYWDAIFWWNGEIWQLGSLKLTDETLGVTSCDE